MKFEMGYVGIYFGQALSPVIPALLGGMFYYRWKWRRSIKYIP